MSEPPERGSGDAADPDPEPRSTAPGDRNANSARGPEAGSLPETADVEPDVPSAIADLVDDFLRRHRAGERPSVDEYIKRYQPLSDRIRDLFAAALAMERPALDVALPTERVGAIIGRYKLLERIGEGGFGVVYMAEQQHPVRRKVALKVIKPGIDTRQVIARFEAERQALALMDHENIARVLDAGATDSGRPYFVMELVHGVPITEYCDKNQLAPRERLELFVQVCRAVQHAHTKGIIHRDIKPTNVLVTLHEGIAVPKVIDFGVAKATGQQLTERTLFTHFAQMVGTPLYMSPEQAEMTSADVDTRSDIYSLGVLLYELLTGTTPLDKERVKQAAFDEVRRLIREEEPQRPSTRLSTMGDKLATVSAQRKVEPGKLPRLVRGELDWIVMKALEKDRNRRYETANAFAQDIGRFLKDESVEACPPSAAYRFRKFARRNRGPLAAITAVLSMLVLLVIALSISNVHVARERNQKAEALGVAQAERHRAESNFIKAQTAIARLLTQPATGMNEWALLPPALRKKFAEEAASYYQNLLAERSDDPTLRYETAIGYRGLGFLNWRLKDYEQSEKFLRESIAILDPLGARYPERPEYRQNVGWARIVLSWTLADSSRPDEAQRVLEEAQAIYEKLIAENPRHGDYPDELFWCYQKLLSLVLPTQGVDEQQMLRRKDELLARIPAQTMAAPIVYGRLGEYYAQKHRWDESIAHFRQGLELFQKQTPQSRVKRNLAPLRLEYEVCLADALIDSGRPSGQSEAIQLLERAVADRPGDGIALRDLGLTHARLGRWSEAAAVLARSVEAAPADVQLWYALATLQLMAGDVQAYRRTCREMLKIVGGAGDAKLGGRVALTCSLAPEAVDDMAALLRLADRAPGQEEQFTCVRGLAEYRAGRLGVAIELLHPRADRLKPWDIIGFSTLSMAHQHLGHEREAAAALAQAREINQKIGADPAKGQPLPWDLIVHLVQARIVLREAEQILRDPSTAPAGVSRPAD